MLRGSGASRSHTARWGRGGVALPAPSRGGYGAAAPLARGARTLPGLSAALPRRWAIPSGGTGVGKPLPSRRAEFFGFPCSPPRREGEARRALARAQFGRRSASAAMPEMADPGTEPGTARSGAGAAATAGGAEDRSDGGGEAVPASPPPPSRSAPTAAGSDDGGKALSAAEYARRVHQWLWDSYCGYLSWHCGLPALLAAGPAARLAAPPPPPPPPPSAPPGSAPAAYYSPFYLFAPPPAAAAPGPRAPPSPAPASSWPPAAAGLSPLPRATPGSGGGSAAPREAAGRPAGE